MKCPKCGYTDFTLTERELEIAALLSLSNKDIAHILTIAENTVRAHVSTLMNKLTAVGRTDILLKLLNEGILSIDKDFADDGKGIRCKIHPPESL